MSGLSALAPRISPELTKEIADAVQRNKPELLNTCGAGYACVQIGTRHGWIYGWYAGYAAAKATPTRSAKTTEIGLVRRMVARCRKAFAQNTRGQP